MRPGYVTSAEITEIPKKETIDHRTIRYSQDTESWMQATPLGHGRVYAPGQSASPSLKGHRLNDRMNSLLSASTTPAVMLNFSAFYTYDSLTV
jgi:hypothetical protein